ncbi:MAG: phytoene desaturase family protein [Cognatishimia sp.]|nr:phytoene desaturase family protein [Cognatishimia sp.]
MSRAVVIGGGFGGIAAALRLRAKGHDVTLIDRCSRLGGRAQGFERDGYRHDAGPTVITAPFLFRELFDLFNRPMEQYADIVPLSLWYRFEFPDGSRFDYGGEIEDTLAEIARFNPDDQEGYLRLLEKSRQIYQLGFEGLSARPFHSFPTMLAQIPKMLQLGSYRTVWQLVSKHLQDWRLRRAFSVQPLLVGGNPFDTTSIYNLIHFLERKHGVHFAMGGTAALVDGLARLMSEVGVTVRLGETVSGIDVDDGKVSGIRLKGGAVLPTDLVVSNSDPAHLYAHMLPQKHARLSAKLKTRYADKSMGLYVLFFGTEGTYPDVAHHTIWLGQRYEGLLRDIFHNKLLSDDISIYLHRPTATDPSFAPVGHDSFYALVPVPNLQAGIDWDIEGPRMRDRVVKTLDSNMLPELRHRIRSDFWMTPKDFEHDYLSPAGAGFSIAPHFTQSAWFRFHNRAEGPKGLYLVGAGTHPGAGLPGVLCSAKVVDGMIPTVAQAQPTANLEAAE